MSTSTRIYLFRHGRTDWNAEGRIQGHLDIPLNDEGREQARRLAPPLARLGIEAFLSSDLLRTRETALLARGSLEVPIEFDAGLREIYLGKLQGLTSAEIVERFGPEFSERLSGRPLDDEAIAMLGSESGEQVVARALAAIRRFVQANGHRTIAVATHGGVIRRLLQHASEDRAFPAPIANSVLFPFQWQAQDDLWVAENASPLPQPI